jgi:hypothetical protein
MARRKAAFRLRSAVLSCPCGGLWCLYALALVVLYTAAGMEIFGAEAIVPSKAVPGLQQVQGKGAP